MKLFPRLLHEARQSKASLLLAICFTLIAGILSIFQARQISTLVSKVFLQGQDLQSVTGILLVVLVIILIRAGFVWGGEAIASAGARRIKHNLRRRLYTHILNLGPAYLRGEAGEAEVRTGELVNVTTEGVEALEAYFSQYLPQTALALLVPTSILIFVFQSDVPSGLVMLVTAPLLPLFMYMIGSGAELVTRKQWRGLSRMSAYFLDVLQGLTTLKSLGRSRDQVAIIKKVSEQYRQSTMSVLKVTFLSAMVLEMIATLSTAVVAVEIGIRLLYGRMAFEQAFFVLLLAPEFYHPLRLLGTRFHAGMAGVEAGKRIFELLDLPASQTFIDTGNPSPSSQENAEAPAIKFKDVSFSYSNNNPALQGISIDIPIMKTTALVGESGAGKTTLTWLILR
ncbi:MAG TPA: ABC transporter transmembrane domain-containing protein, partial [Anaerolineales bacterium]